MKTLLTLTFALVAVHLTAQLPNGLTEQEEAIMRDYYENRTHERSGITTPPNGSNIRTAAEWEEIQALVITWTGQYNSIHAQIVDAAQEECLVIITCADSIDVQNTLINNGVPLTNLAFIEQPFNSVWIRDYAANTVYTNAVDSLILVDWIYNRPRPDDDAMPASHAALLNIPFYETTSNPADLVNTGGNWMSDGQGTAFASELILEENEPNNPYNVSAKTEAEIDAIVNDYMGIDRYIKMPTLPYDGIHHIDMHMKLLDEETILVSEYPTGVADGPQIEANMLYVLSNYNSYFGTPYKLERITVPPSPSGLYPDNNGYYRTYSNCVFVNGTVIVPFYRTEYDTTAQRILEENLPGYNIVGIDVDNQGQNLIASSGAIHCITHTIGVADPLLIVHQPLSDTYATIDPYLVTAEIQHRSGISSATLYYRLSGATTYQSVSMTASMGNNWEGFIPAQVGGSKIEYYVEATSNSGKTLTRPLVAPAGYWDFNILETAVNVNQLENDGVTVARVFPNPASAITCIELNLEQPTDLTVNLCDVTGRTVEVLYTGRENNLQPYYFFDASQYPAGLYYVQVQGMHYQQVRPVVIE